MSRATVEREVGFSRSPWRRGQLRRTPLAAVTIATAVALALSAAGTAIAAVGDVSLVLPATAPAKGTSFDVRVTIDSGAEVLGGYELRVQFDTAVLQYISASPGTVAGFTDPIRIAANEISGGAIRFGAYQGFSRSAPTGITTVATLRLKAIGAPGTSSSLTLSVLKLLTSEVDDVVNTAVSGLIVVNLLPLGDVNGDGVANQVSDAVFLTRALLGFQTLTPPEISSADVNGDGTPQTVSDLVYLVNVLLGLQTPIGKQGALAGPSLIASLGVPTMESDWRLVPVEAASATSLGGVLLRLRADPARLELGEPRPSARLSGMQIATARHGDEWVILVHSPAGVRIPAGDEPLLWLPVRARRIDAGVGELPAPGVGGAALALLSGDAADDGGARRQVEVAGGGTDLLTLPARFALRENVPNPFNPRTELRFDLPVAGRIKLAIYDTAGRRVTTLLDRDLPAGSYSLPWDGQDNRGRAVASGVYHARLDGPGQAPALRKLVLVR